MIEYEWVSVTNSRYFGPQSYLWSNTANRLGWYDERGFTIGSTTASLNCAEIVESVVADFREAVAAQFYDAAKDDPTLVPLSCLQYIDNIVYYNLCLRLKCYCTQGQQNPFISAASTLYTEWKRAVLYRRELGTFTKRIIAGNMFPEVIMDNLPSGTPLYFPKPKLNRSL
jgi:hypothetical protein